MAAEMVYDTGVRWKTSLRGTKKDELQLVLFHCAGAARVGFLILMRPHIIYPYVAETYEFFHFWNTIPASPTFFPAARKECRPRKGRRPVTAA